MFAFSESVVAVNQYDSVILFDTRSGEIFRISHELRDVIDSPTGRGRPCGSRSVSSTSAIRKLVRLGLVESTV